MDKHRLQAIFSDLNPEAFEALLSAFKAVDYPRRALLTEAGQTERFISMEIYNRSGESIYQATLFAPNEVYNIGGWDSISPGSGIYEGRFSYQIEVLNIHGERAVIQGHACAISCENPANIDPALCAFPLKPNGTGKLAASLPNGEEASACFE